MFINPKDHSPLKKRGKKVKMKVSQSCPILCDPMEIQSMEFYRLGYWCG